MDHLAILSQTIAEHAKKLAREEWDNEHRSFLVQILKNAGLGQAGATIEIDGRIVPVEAITKALREEFLKNRVAQLVPKLTESVVGTAFKKVIEDEQK
jgi:hypothetical protein